MMDEALRKARAAADRLEKVMESNGEVTKNDINRAVQAIRNLADKHEEEMNTYHAFC